MKKVFVSGCFDMLHSGHVAFLQEASKFGDLYVGIGGDENIRNLKGRYPVNTEDERRYMINALKCVKTCVVNSGWGIMDFVDELDRLKPDVFVVNEDGNSPNKAALVKSKGIDYKVLKRIPHGDLPVRSTTSLRTVCTIPFRIDLAGGWLDQPFVSTHHPGPVLTISLEPTIDFNERSGMASSTRRKAIELWKTEIPTGNKEHLAKILFSYENPPGTDVVAGSQDALGIVLPGLNKLDYAGHYWPHHITCVHESDILDFLEQHLYLIPLEPRDMDYDVLDDTRVSDRGAQALADAANHCWEAILNRDLASFGQAFREAFEAQISMFPNMVDDHIMEIIHGYRKDAIGWKLSGAGGGGYIILVAEKPVAGAFQIRIRRKETDF